MSKHRKELDMADENENEVTSDEQLDDEETVSAPLTDDEAAAEEPKAEDAPEEEHAVEPHVKQGKIAGKWANYGGWTSQDGTAYNGVERSNEHPTSSG